MKTRDRRRLFTVLMLSLSISFTQADEIEHDMTEACQPFVEEKSALENVNKAPPPFSNGLIWKISKQGKTNYLYGTIHTQDQRATRFPSQVRLGIFRSQVYLMEINVSQETNDIFQQAMFYEDGKSLKDKLDTPFIEALGQQLTDYGYEADDAMRIKPWAAFSTIGTPKPVRALTLDQVLMNYARSRGLEIIGIESMQDLIDSLSSISEPDQITILKDTICNRPTIIRESWELIKMHMFDDLAGMVKFNEQPHHDESIFERYMETMVYSRNQRMAERILPYLENGGAFVAVGALHLPGEKGLLALLKNHGFEIENIK